VRRLAVALVCAVLGFTAAAAAPSHPLDPLSADELIAVRDILARSGRFSADTNFAWIQLDEPAKSVVADFTPGAGFGRAASLAAIDYDKGKAFRVIVDIKAGRIASVSEVIGGQPGLNDRDSAIARTIVNADPRIRDALVKRGFSIPGRISDAVHLQYMAAGRDRSLDQENNRLMRVLFASDQNAVGDSSPFVDDLMAVVDLYAKRVIRLRDLPGAPPRRVPHDVFDAKVRDAISAAGAALPRQGDGRSFSIDGQVVEWRNWRFRYGFNLREGLVLYQVGINDDGRMRPVLYRASVSEVLTSYLDPDEVWSWMRIFDEGCFGLGYLSAAVQPGREVPANAVTLGPILPDSTVPRFSDVFADRLYLYERDAGNLVYHQQGSRVVHARATELVIGFFAALGNYTYGFNWVFRQDGAFAFEVELAGQILTRFAAPQECETCAAIARGPGAAGESRTTLSPAGEGGRVHPGVIGLTHQHWFNLRLDFDIDGTANAVMENNVRHIPAAGAGAQQPALALAQTVFGKAADARRHMDENSSRTWTIYNPSRRERTGRPPGYTVMPMENAAAAAPRDDAAGFTLHHFWATPHREGELYAAGRYPNQAKSGDVDGIESYADDSSIYDQDVVIWYSLGTTHVPRPEDYPVISNMKLSVAFRPDGFFSRNPVLAPPNR